MRKHAFSLAAGICLAIVAAVCAAPEAFQHLASIAPALAMLGAAPAVVTPETPLRQPLVGERIVFTAGVDPVFNPGEEVEGIIETVWSPSCVNVKVQRQGSDGPPLLRTSVLLVQRSIPQPQGYFCVFAPDPVAPAVVSQAPAAGEPAPAEAERERELLATA